MQSILQSLEQQHEEEKRSALERQRVMYEHELEQLRRRLSPEKQHFRSMDRFSCHSPNAQQRLRQWAEERWVKRIFNTFLNLVAVFFLRDYLNIGFKYLNGGLASSFDEV